MAPALLVLEDGRTFRGESYGATGETFGEAVFSTGMTGYQETLTDPSYHRQVVVMTAPHIGNTGMNDGDRQRGRAEVALRTRCLGHRLLLVRPIDDLVPNHKSRFERASARSVGCRCRVEYWEVELEALCTRMREAHTDEARPNESLIRVCLSHPCA